jgi:hypothetical protein
VRPELVPEITYATLAQRRVASSHCFVELREDKPAREAGARRLTGAAERLARACGLENGAVVDRVDIRRGVATIADAIPNAR